MVPSFLARDRIVAGARLQPLADPAGGARRPPVHRAGLRDQRLQDRAGRALRHQPDRDRRHLLDRDRDARPLRRGLRHLGGPQRSPGGDVHRRLLLGAPASSSRALGIGTEQLWLVYLGYGVIGGIGLGIGYISPVSTLIKWFPDRPGLATGMAIMGFGGGALIASPLSAPADGALRQRVRRHRPDVGRRRARRDAALRHPRPRLLRVHDVRRLHRSGCPPTAGSPTGWDPLAGRARRSWSPRPASRRRNAIRTPQFWLLWVVLFCNVTAGIGILEQASPMIQDFFRDATAPRR